tara:strand:- start:4692 stop:4976 length:285 start_codon:yes stop_codon:yes gene_type:complete
MIGILAKLTIKSGTNEEFEKAVKKMSEAVKINEPGNLYYDVYRGEEETTYIVMERYESQSDLDAHSQYDHFRNIGAEMGQYMSEPPEVKILKSL